MPNSVERSSFSPCVRRMLWRLHARPQCRPDISIRCDNMPVMLPSLIRGLLDRRRKSDARSHHNFARSQPARPICRVPATPAFLHAGPIPKCDKAPAARTPHQQRALLRHTQGHALDRSRRLVGVFVVDAEIRAHGLPRSGPRSNAHMARRAARNSDRL